MHLRNLDKRRSELLGIGVAGVAGAACCLYALLIPALALLYLMDGYHFVGLPSKLLGGAVIFVTTGIIAGGLVVAGAAMRTTCTGRWPGRSFIFGAPGVLIGAFAFAFTPTLALLL